MILHARVEMISRLSMDTTIRSFQAQVFLGLFFWEHSDGHGKHWRFDLHNTVQQDKPPPLDVVLSPLVFCIYVLSPLTILPFFFPSAPFGKTLFWNGKILHNGHDTRRLGALGSWINPVFGFLNPGFFFQGDFQNWQLFACFLFPTLCFLLFLNLSFHFPFHTFILPSFLTLCAHFKAHSCSLTLISRPLDTFIPAREAVIKMAHSWAHDGKKKKGMLEEQRAGLPALQDVHLTFF
ncbi:hypothetical protein V8F33_005314 [Rhypophila sp. PSN 637]